MNSAAELDLARMLPGLGDTVHDAQQVFRCVLDAFSRPGRLFEIPVSVVPPEGVSLVQCMILLALADCDTPVWIRPDLRDGAAGHYLRFHCGCPLAADMGDAHFVVLSGLGALPQRDILKLGDASYPDRSATVLVEVPELESGGPIRLRGPGIADMQAISVAGWTSHTTAFLRENRAAFPLGVDLLLSNGGRLMGLPRTTVVEI